jgi:hypothetical protein
MAQTADYGTTPAVTYCKLSSRQTKKHRATALHTSATHGHTVPCQGLNKKGDLHREQQARASLSGGPESMICRCSPPTATGTAIATMLTPLDPAAWLLLLLALLLAASTSAMQSSGSLTWRHCCDTMCSHKRVAFLRSYTAKQGHHGCESIKLCVAMHSLDGCKATTVAVASSPPICWFLSASATAVFVDCGSTKHCSHAQTMPMHQADT